MHIQYSDQQKKNIRNLKSISVYIRVSNYLHELLALPYFETWLMKDVLEYIKENQYVCIMYSGHSDSYKYIFEKDYYARTSLPLINDHTGSLESVKHSLSVVYHEIVKSVFEPITVSPLYGYTILTFTVNDDHQLCINGHEANDLVFNALGLMMRESIYKKLKITTKYSSYSGVGIGFGDSVYPVHLLEKIITDYQNYKNQLCL